MWGKMAKTVDAEAQEEEIRQIYPEITTLYQNANTLTWTFLLMASSISDGAASC
jgi:hypothetical protein